MSKRTLRRACILNFYSYNNLVEISYSKRANMLSKVVFKKKDNNCKVHRLVADHLNSNLQLQTLVVQQFIAGHATLVLLKIRSISIRKMAIRG